MLFQLPIKRQALFLFKLNFFWLSKFPFFNHSLIKAQLYSQYYPKIYLFGSLLLQYSQTVNMFLSNQMCYNQYKKRMKENQNKTRLGWTQQEEQMIRQLYQIKGEKSWTLIAQQVFQKGGNKRSGKQCRQRYKNYIKLSMDCVDRKWTELDNSYLFKMYIEKGSKWVEISNSMSGWSQNFLKNKFYGALRKLEGVIKRICLDSSRKLKPIKYQTITKILEAREQNNFGKMGKTQLEVTKLQFCQKLRQDIINAAGMCENITDQQAADICHRGHEFNKLTRFQNMARSRNLKNSKKKAPFYVKNTKLEKINSSQALECLTLLNSEDERKSTIPTSSLKVQEQGMDEQNSLCLPELFDLDIDLGHVMNPLCFDNTNPILHQWSLSDFNEQVDEADHLEFL